MTTTRAAGGLRRAAWLPALELAAILAWSLWIGRAFLNLDPALWPHGTEVGLSIEPLYQWDRLRECGACVLWNGLFNGGAPAFLETHAPFQHPLIILLTLLSDPVAAAKISLMLSLAAAGVAQWWLGRALGLGWFPRLWAGLLAVAGGHLAGRMELGLVWMVFSNASAALVLAPLLRLGQHGRRRDGLAMAVLLALALLAGQGYAQLALLIVCAIACAIFVIDRPPHLRPVWKEFARAAALALLLTGILWVPLANCLPSLAKDTDLEMLGTAPPAQVPLSLMIQDVGYYLQPGPGRAPFPAIYAHPIGWLALALFALAALRLPWAPARRSRLFLILPAIAILLLSSDLIPSLVGRPIPALLAAVRFPTLMLGVAVPLILGAAALQLDDLLRCLGRWQVAGLAGRRLRAAVLAAAGAAVLGLTLPGAYGFTRHWMLAVELPATTAEVVDRLVVDTAAWVRPPSEMYWVPLLASRGQKVTGIYRPWWLDAAPIPLAALEADRASEHPSRRFDLVIHDIGIAAVASAHYARLESEGATVACPAASRGGWIRVTCPESAPGTLTVMEHRAPGWRATCEGQTVALERGPWLALSGVSGPVTCTFSYRPWDVPAGLALSLLGVWIALSEWRRTGRLPAGAPPSERTTAGP